MLKNLYLLGSALSAMMAHGQVIVIENTTPTYIEDYCYEDDGGEVLENGISPSSMLMETAGTIVSLGVSFTIDHADKDALEIYLERQSALGVKSARFLIASNVDTFQEGYSIDHFDGEDSFGIWTLTVEDTDYQRDGTLQNWALSFDLGTSALPCSGADDLLVNAANAGDCPVSLATGSSCIQVGASGATCTASTCSEGTLTAGICTAAEPCVCDGDDDDDDDDDDDGPPKNKINNEARGSSKSRRTSSSSESAIAAGGSAFAFVVAGALGYRKWRGSSETIQQEATAGPELDTMPVLESATQ